MRACIPTLAFRHTYAAAVFCIFITSHGLFALLLVQAGESQYVLLTRYVSVCAERLAQVASVYVRDALAGRESSTIIHSRTSLRALKVRVGGRRAGTGPAEKMKKSGVSASFGGVLLDYCVVLVT